VVIQSSDQERAQGVPRAVVVGVAVVVVDMADEFLW